MTQKHKNAEYLIAFANGEEVEYKFNGLDFAHDPWRRVLAVAAFDNNALLFRMKPKTITTKGYKRYAWKGGDDMWHVDTFEAEQEEITTNTPGLIILDKEWQYHVIEEV